MGSQPREVDQKTPSATMLRTVLALALVAVVKSQGDISQRMMRQIAEYNYRSACWGQENMDNSILALIKATEKCMQMEPSFDVEAAINPQNNPFAPLIQQKNPFKSLLTDDFDSLQSLWRNKRAAAPAEGFLKATEEDLVDFLMDYQEWGENFVTSIGNMSCVSQEMGYLNDDLEINMEHYTKWDDVEGFDVSASLPGKDPELKEKFINAMTDCKAISDNWPQTSLNRNTVTKAFGNIIFFKCANKAEKALCAMGQMYHWFEKLYGKYGEDENSEDYGLPKDKYDAAAVSIMVLDASQTPEEKAVNDFFWGRF